MTLLIQNTVVSTVSQTYPYALALAFPTLTVDNQVAYNEATVQKILAARDGKNASAPADKDKFIDWLNE
jgi:hypothetical protein